MVPELRFTIMGISLLVVEMEGKGAKKVMRYVQAMPEDRQGELEDMPFYQVQPFPSGPSIMASSGLVAVAVAVAAGAAVLLVAVAVAVLAPLQEPVVPATPRTALQGSFVDAVDHQAQEAMPVLHLLAVQVGAELTVVPPLALAMEVVQVLEVQVV